MVGSVNLSKLLSAKLNCKGFVLAQNIKVGLQNVGDQITITINADHVPENLFSGSLHMAVDEFSKVLQRLAQGTDGNSTCESRSCGRQDITFRKGGADAIDRI